MNTAPGARSLAGHRSRMTTLTIAALLLTVIATGSVRAAGRGVDPGTATIHESTSGGFAGDGRTYDNTGGDEVSFMTRGPYPGNAFYLQAGGGRSSRTTAVQGHVCEKTIFVVTSATSPDWYTDGGTGPVVGRARLICEPTDGGSVEYRWGYAATGECVDIRRSSRPSFTFASGAACPADVSASDRGPRKPLGLESVAFLVDGTEVGS